MKIGLVSILVPNPKDAFKFYTEVLGFQSFLCMPEAWVYIIISPEDPKGVQVLLEPNQNPLSKTFQEGLYNANIPCIVFYSSDIQKEYEQLKVKGIVFRKEPTKTDYGTETIFEDTFGNLIMLLQPVSQ